MVYRTEKVISSGQWQYLLQSEKVIQGERIEPGEWFVMFNEHDEILRVLPLELYEGKKKQAVFQLWNDFNVEHWKKFIEDWCT